MSLFSLPFLGNISSLQSSYKLGHDIWSLMTMKEVRAKLEQRVQEVSSHVVEAASPRKKNEPIQITREVQDTLDKIKSTIDFTYLIAHYATKGLIYFTLLNAICYHFTGWINGVAITYFISIVFFGTLAYDCSKLESEAEDLKWIFRRTLGPREELKETELVALHINNSHERATLSLSHVQDALRKIEKLQKNLFLLEWPLRMPLAKIHSHLTQIESQINSQLNPND